MTRLEALLAVAAVLAGVLMLVCAGHLAIELRG
jgi:hypothetical protein